MKIRIMIGFTAWICEGSQVVPSQFRFRSSAWRTHIDPVWSKSAQNTATKM